MLKAVVDTDILSEVFKGQNPLVLATTQRYLVTWPKLTFTSVTASEFLFGFYAKDARTQINRAKTFLKANDELVPTSEDYWLAAEINGALKRIGRPIGDGDTMIAACVVNRGLTLATGNLRHYQFVKDAGFPLALDDWKRI